MRYRLALSVLVVLGLGSAAASAKRVLTLEDCVEIAVRRAPQVGIYREQLRSARSQVLQRYASFLPTANLNMTAGHTFIGPTKSITIDPQGRFIKPTGFDYESYSFSLRSNLTLFDWGSSPLRLASAKKSAQAAEYDLRYQKDMVTADVIRAYYDYLRKQKLREVQEHSVEAAEKNLEQVEAFYRIGSKTRAEVLQAKVRLANTRLSLVSARNAEEIARATLASLLNFSLEEEFEIDSSLAISPVEPDLAQEVKYMLAHRPDLQASRLEVEAAQKSLTAALNSRWPSFSAYFVYGWNDRAFPENANFFRRDYNWGVGVSMNIDIFDGFATKSSILAAKAQRRIAELQLEQAKLNAILEVKQLVSTLKEAGERIRLSQESLAQAEENYRLAGERYRVGAGTMLEVIEAEVALTEARAALVEAKCDYLIAKADLMRATGKKVRVD